MKPTYTMQMSIAELKKAASEFGYTIAKDGTELEAFPKGKRGDLSIFEDDRENGRYHLLQTIRATATAVFRAKLDVLATNDETKISDETKEALVAWFAYHGKEWGEALSHAWYSGAYSGFAHKNESGILQRLRNTNGHEVLEVLIG